MKVRWLRTALRNLDSHATYIAERNQDAAARMVERVRSAANLLQDFPEMGRTGRVPRTREFVVDGTPYIVIYRITDAIEILRILHGSQRWPRRKRGSPDI